jgi:hypothetical protein
MKKKNITHDATANDGEKPLNQKLVILAEALQILHHDMQEIAHVSALAQRLMQRIDADDEEGKQFIYQALCVIEKVTGCKGDGSREHWATRIAKEEAE